MQSAINSISSLAEYNHFIEHYKEIYIDTNNSLNYFILQNATQISTLEIIEKRKYLFSKRLDVKVTSIYNSNDREVLRITLVKIVEEEQLSGTIILDNNKMSKITLIVSDASPKFLTHVVSNFVDYLYPFYKRKFISSSQIKERLSLFLQRGYQLTASMVSTKRWWEKPNKILSTSSTIQFPQALPIETVLSEIEKTKSFINSITLNILDKLGKRRILRCYISRFGRIQFKDGNYQLFKTLVLEPMTLQRLSKFRAEKETFGEIVPIKVNFASGLESYNEKLIRDNFYNVISKDRNYKLLLYHGGNPYYHIGITDSKDGSTFDLLFYDSGSSKKTYEMLIIPKLNVSMMAIDRLIERVFFRFGEGTIEKWQQ
ncbi:MAG: hypothetical protein QXN16_03925 [Candidatus Micrarchaeaceae archaeon]